MNNVYHALVIAVYGHAVLSLLQFASVRDDIVVFADLREVQELLEAVEVNVACRVEGIRFPSSGLLIEGDAELALADCAERIWATGKAALVAALVRVTASAVGRDSLHPELQARSPGIGTSGPVQRVLADVLDHLLHRERVKWVELTMFSVLKQLIARVRIDRAPRSWS